MGKTLNLNVTIRNYDHELVRKKTQTFLSKHKLVYGMVKKTYGGENKESVASCVLITEKCLVANI